MSMIDRGRYRARVAETARDIRAAQRLRHLAFSGPGEGLDADRFDTDCSHMLIEQQGTGRLVCCYRFLPLASGAEIGRSYSAQFYDLSLLEALDAPMVEMGRFCSHPDIRDGDVLRVAWGAMTALVDARGIEMLFGCASFAGTDPAPYRDSLALLAARHLAPARWSPAVRAPEVVPLGPARGFDERGALQRIPSLLRSYLGLGGRVSDHAVIDREMNTLHVFTGVDIRAIPPARKRLLRAVAG